MMLCLEAQLRIKLEGDLRNPVGQVRVDLLSQGLEFKFRPLVMEKERPSRQMLLDVLAAVSNQVIQPYGARELEFQWLDGGGRHIGFGYLESKKGGAVGMKPVVMNGNVTGSLTDIRGMNRTRPMMDFLGSNSTVDNESVITA